MVGRVVSAFVIVGILILPSATKAAFSISVNALIAGEAPTAPGITSSVGEISNILFSLKGVLSKFNVDNQVSSEKNLVAPTPIPTPPPPLPKIEESVVEKKNIIFSGKEPAINKKLLLAATAAVGDSIQNLGLVVRDLIKSGEKIIPSSGGKNENKEESKEESGNTGRKGRSEWSLIQESANQNATTQTRGTESDGGSGRGNSEWSLIQESINQSGTVNLKDNTDSQTSIFPKASVSAPESVPVVVQGLTSSASVSSIDSKLSALENSLKSEIYRVAQNSSVSPGFLQAMSLSQRIDKLSSVDISGSTITGSAISGSFSGDVSAESFSVSGATSTFANGIDLTTGCFSVNGSCLSLVGGSGTPGGNSGNVQFNNGGDFDGNDGLFYLASAGRLGVGTTTPHGFSISPLQRARSFF